MKTPKPPTPAKRLHLFQTQLAFLFVKQRELQSELMKMKKERDTWRETAMKWQNEFHNKDIHYCYCAIGEPIQVDSICPLCIDVKDNFDHWLSAAEDIV